MIRILTAAALLPVLWLAIKRAPAWVFVAVAALVVGLAAWECYALLAARGARPLRLLGLAGSVAVTLSFAVGSPVLAPCLPLALVTMAATVFAMWRRDDPASMLETTSATLFPVLFVGLAFGYPVGLRVLPGEDGTDLLLLLLVCVMASDTAAFYVGTLFGRHRLAPVLSPKKSWEGAAGGVLASVGAALLAHVWFYQRLPVVHAFALGLLLGVAGIAGDLAESMVKRAAGAKDSSAILPGHGGLLDRTDSLLFAGPLLYYYSWTFLGVGW
jgi:phosphatidate cytidylyltransferase